MSWNRVFNHHTSMLLGHSDDNGSQDIGHLRVNYHHKLLRRLHPAPPRVRFGNPVHVYNNYYNSNSGYGVASAEGAGVLGHYFENVDDPYHLGESCVSRTTRGAVHSGQLPTLVWAGGVP